MKLLRNFRVACCAICALFVLCAPIAANAERTVTLRFAVTDDSRADGNAKTDMNGVGAVMMREIAKDVASQKVDFFVFPGDMTRGMTDDPEKLASMFRTWWDTMAPVTKAGIPVYVSRGNHEVHPGWHGEPGGSQSALISYLKAFPTPGNGPEGETGLTYSFSKGNAKFIVFDQYIGRKAGFDNGKFAKGANHGQMMNRWVLDQLAASDKPVNFVFGHEALFAARHTDCMVNDPDSRDALAAELSRLNGAYISGHDHFYLRGKVTGPQGKGFPAFIVGTAGAGNQDFESTAKVSGYDGGYRFDAEKNLGRRANPTFGWLLVTVYSDNSWSAEFRGFKFNNWSDPADISVTPVTVMDRYESGPGGK